MQKAQTKNKDSFVINKIYFLNFQKLGYTFSLQDMTQSSLLRFLSLLFSISPTNETKHEKYYGKLKAKKETVREPFLFYVILYATWSWKIIESGIQVKRHS